MWQHFSKVLDSAIEGWLQRFDVKGPLSDTAQADLVFGSTFHVSWRQVRKRLKSKLPLKDHFRTP